MTGDSISQKGTLGLTGGRVLIQTRGRPVVGIEISGTFVQGFEIDEATNGDNWRPAQVFNASGVGVSNTPSAAGIYFVNAAGRTAISVTQISYTSGTATIMLTAGYGAVGAGGGGGGGGAVTVADGADVALGFTTDAAVTGDNPGTISAKLRGLLKSIANVISVRLQDGVSGNLATVSAFHSADNQNPGGTAFGLLTGGVAQLLNAQNRLDRQRETGADNITAVGISTGTQQLKSPISTTVSSGGAAGSTAVTLAATKFTNRGANAWIGVGSILTFEPGTANQEQVIVTAVNYGTNVVTVFGAGAGNGLVNTHSNGSTVVSGAYNEARDATAPDGSTGAGFAAGATYLFNGTLNAGAGGWEGERSFLGELAGATGAGAAIAQEYEDTAGGPVLASGVPSGLRLMPAQALQGKNRQFQTITSTTAGNTSITFSGGASATNLVLPGWPLLLAGGSTSEVVYTSQTWVPGSSATVPLQSPVVNNGQTSAAFDAYAVNGPGLNGFNAFGIGIEEEAVFDPVTGLYYLERAATSDGVTTQNVVMECPALYNGATMDRWPGTAAHGGKTTVDDGQNAALGATTDAAVTGDNSGTVSAKMRGLTKILADIWDSVNHRIKVDGSGVTQPVSGTVTANQGTANTVGNAWPTKLTDGTNTTAVKAASTAAVAADPSAVVALSPNSPLPTGANTIGSAGQAIGSSTNRTASGSIAALNGTVSVSAQGAASVAFQVVTNGTWSGTLTPQISGDGGTTWMNHYFIRYPAAQQANPDVRTALALGSSQTEFWFVPCGALDMVRLQATSYSAGSVTITAEAGLGPCPVQPALAFIADANGGGTQARVTTSNDALSLTGLQTNSLAYGYNGATADRTRHNVDVTLLASAARTTTQTSADITTYNCQGIIFTLDVTSAGTGSVTVSINYKDPASGKYILLLAGSAVTTNSTTMYMVDPRIPAVANSIAQKDIGRTIQIVVTANNANSVTYSVGYTLVPG